MRSAARSGVSGRVGTLWSGRRSDKACSRRVRGWVTVRPERQRGVGKVPRLFDLWSELV